MIERAAAGAGLEIKAHPHMLRHACGYPLANKGHDTRAIQGWLGHRSITSTGRCVTPSAPFAGAYRGRQRSQAEQLRHLAVRLGRRGAEPYPPTSGILIAAVPAEPSRRLIPGADVVDGRQVPVQDHLASKAKWYKAKAIECAALAKSARPNFIREIYRKAAVRYDFAEGVLRQRIDEAVALTSEERQALNMLAARNECSQSIMMAHGLSIGVLRQIVRSGVATQNLEVKDSGTRSIIVKTLRITTDGRLALAGK
jgi:hypothetical protein